MPRAIEYLGRAGPGGSAAVLFMYSDGARRVTKFQNNPQDAGQERQCVLTNELIVARIASHLEAACPEGSVVWVDEPYLAAARGEIPELQGAKAGASFGSEWVEGTYGPGEVIFQAAANRVALAAVPLLYAWTRNTDVKQEHFLWRDSPGGEALVYGFDHGHCFDARWDASIVTKASDVPLRQFPPLDAAVLAANVQEHLRRVKELTDEQIHGFVSELPLEWSISEDEVAAMQVYLGTSRVALEQSIGAVWSV